MPVLPTDKTARPRVPTATLLMLAVERASARKLLAAFLLVVGGSSAAYYFLSFLNHGIVASSDLKRSITWLDALYFSFVTISSLGYGDFQPVGVGRIVAVAEVMAGLIILSLFVARLSSERTNNLVRLIYAGDLHQRLKNYAAELAARTHELEECAIGYLSADEVASIIMRIRRILGALGSYITYHTHAGMLLQSHEQGILRAVMGATERVATMSLRVAESAALPSGQRPGAVRLANMANRICASYAQSSGDMEAGFIARRVYEMLQRYQRRVSEGIVYRHDRVHKITDRLLDRVAEKLPAQPWRKGVHKEVAIAVGISNRLAQSAIEELIQRGKFRRQNHGVVEANSERSSGTAV